MGSQLKFDSITIGFFAISLATPILFGLWTRDFVTQLPTILILSGFALYLLSRRIGKKDEGEVVAKTDEILTMKTVDIAVYSIICLGAMIIAGLTAGSLAGEVQAQQMSVQYTEEQEILYTIHLAVAEEIFFRVGWLAFFWAWAGPIPAIILSSGLFSVYHLSRYGAGWTEMTYIFGAGVVMATFCYKLQKPAPAIISHILNNLLPYLLGAR